MKSYWYLFLVPVFMGLTACHDDNDEPKQRVSYLSCPDNHHPHMIDLGLPSGTLWSCCNVDTDHPEKQSPSNYGGYYAWSETKTKETYELSNYKFYGNSSDYHDLELEIAGTEDDVAHVEWKGDWQMPTINQFKELIANCTYERTEENGVNGGKFTSKINGGSIFLPAAGSRIRDNLIEAGSKGQYWSSTYYDSSTASTLYLSSNAEHGTSRYYCGHNVRPVIRNNKSFLKCPDTHHPHKVDLGLPSGTIWSCCNVDTDHPEKQSPTNYGGYYAWGETKTKSTYYANNYIHYDYDGPYPIISNDIGKDIAGTEYDVAHVEWKGDWQMPTIEQFKELIANCTYEWAEEKGINGGKFTSKTNGNIIFLPAAGLRFGSELHYARAIGHYLSSTLDDSYCAFNLALYMYFVDTYYNATFSYGYSIRPVIRK